MPGTGKYLGEELLDSAHQIKIDEAARVTQIEVPPPEAMVGKVCSVPTAYSGSR